MDSEYFRDIPRFLRAYRDREDRHAKVESFITGDDEKGRTVEVCFTQQLPGHNVETIDCVRQGPYYTRAEAEAAGRRVLEKMRRIAESPAS